MEFARINIQNFLQRYFDSSNVTDFFFARSIVFVADPCPLIINIRFKKKTVNNNWWLRTERDTTDYYNYSESICARH